MGNAYDRHREARVVRHWVATASAAASNSAAVATKTGASGQIHVVTKVVAFYDGTVAAIKLLSVQDGSTVKARLPVLSSVALGDSGVHTHTGGADGDPIFKGTDNTTVSVSLAASATSPVLGYVTVYGYTIGKN